MAKKPRTGDVLEKITLQALIDRRYSCTTQTNIGKRLGIGKHVVDIVATRNGRTILVSLKWQQVGGTTEQKVPFEVISLLYALENNKNFNDAYLVLGGEGWTLRQFYVEGGLKKYIGNTDKVKIVTLEKFVALANTNEL